MWTPSSAGSVSGKSVRRWPPRDSRRSSAQVAIARPAGRGRRAARASSSASRSGPARRQTASRVASVGGSKRHSGGSGAAGGRRLVERRRRGAAAEDEALAERVGGEPVGAVQAGAGALADRVEARQRGAAVEVDRDPAHRVVGGGGDRHRLGARVEPGLGQRLEDVGEAGRVELAQVELDLGSAPSASIRSRIAAVTASRGASSSVKRSAGGVEQRRALAAHRLGDQQAVVAGARAGRGRSGGTGRTRGRRGRRPAAEASTGPAPIAPQGLVVRRHSAAAPPVASTVAAAAIGPASVSTPWQRSPSLQSAVAEVRSQHLDPRLGGDHRRQLRGDLVAGLAAAGVDDAAAGCGRPRGPSASRPSWSRSNSTPRARRSRTASGASSTSTCTAEGRQRPRPAAIVSAAWRSGESSGSSAAARPPWAQ